MRKNEVNAKLPIRQGKNAQKKPFLSNLLAHFPWRLGGLTFIYFFIFSPTTHAATRELKTDTVTFTVDDQTGNYSVVRASPAQTWSGTVGASIKHIMQGEGSDNLGGFKTIEFEFQSDVPLGAEIHVYKDRPLVT